MMLELEVAQVIQAQYLLGEIFSMYGPGPLNKRVLGNSIRSACHDLECQRCGCHVTMLLRSWRSVDGGEVWEENGDPVPPEYRETMWVCLRCDNDMMNGGMSNEDLLDIEGQRQEEDHLYDPINEPCPWGDGQ